MAVLTKEEKINKAKEARAELFSVSQELRKTREKEANQASSLEESFEIISRPLNYYLKRDIYKLPQEEELNTFKGWQAEGFKVKKGEKGLKFFSKPIKKEKKEDETEKDEYTFFSIVYLFQKEQVEKR